MKIKRATHPPGRHKAGWPVYESFPHRRKPCPVSALQKPPSDSEDTLRFAALTGLRPMVEKFPFEKVAEAYARMLSGQAQFRVVLTM